MISSLTFLVFGVSIFLLGVILTPLVLFLRARKDDSWDTSNVTNMYRLVAHITSHPSDFGKMQFEDGTKPFWYINKDEFSEVVETRPKD